MVKRCSMFVVVLLLAAACKKDRIEEKVNRGHGDNVEKKDIPKRTGKVILKTADGRDIYFVDLRDPGRIASEHGFGIRHITGVYGDNFHLDSGAETALIIAPDSEDGTEVMVYLRSKDVRTKNGVHAGMTYAKLLKVLPKVECEAIAEAGHPEATCDIGDGFTAVFPSDSKKLSALDGPRTSKVMATLLGETPMLEIRKRFTDVKAPQKPVAEVRQKGLLPAGVFYFRNFYSPCSETWAPKNCDVPVVAVVDGIYELRAAQERFSAIEKTMKLTPGYPTVAHTDELGLANADKEGVAIVLGFFADKNAAEAWKEKHAPKAKLMGLTASEKMDKEALKHVVQVRKGAAVKGYANASFIPGGDPTISPEKISEKPICNVKGGSFIVADTHPRFAERGMLAQCENGKKAYVHLRDTLLYMIVGIDSAVQVLYIECDAPTFLRWDVDKAGKMSEPQIISTDGC